MHRREAERMKKNKVFSVIAQMFLREVPLSAGIIFTVIGAVGASLLPPLILGEIIDRLAGGSMASVVLLSGYFVMLLLTGVLESAREGLLTVFGQRITHALRSALSEKLTLFDADTLNKEEPGAVVSRIVGDVDTIETLFTAGIISMITDICRIISIFMVIWCKNRGLACLLLILLPFVFGFTRAVQKRMLTAQIANREAVSRAANHVPETIRCIRTIHTLGKEDYMEKRYEEYIENSYRAMERSNFYDAVYSPVILCINAAAVALVMLLAASGNERILTWFGMSVGTSVTVINYISQVFAPIENLGMEIQTIQSAVAGVHRLNEFFEKPERAKSEICLDERKKTVDPIVEFRNVTFGYDEKTVLKRLSFQIGSGEQVTFTGRTGAGKSTIFKLLLGLYRPNEGEVLVEGIPAYEIMDSEKRKLFGYVEQSFHMVPGSIRDQITLFDEKIPYEDVIRAARIVGLHDTIMELEQGYETICRPEIFSQGQWQLLSIARAVSGKPKILLLDEITANLDAETEALVLSALKNAAAGRTVLSISHRTYQGKEGSVRYLELS